MFLRPDVEGTAFFNLAALSVVLWLFWRAKKILQSTAHHQVSMKAFPSQTRVIESFGDNGGL